MRALRTVDLQHGIDRFQPLPRFDGIEVLKLRWFGHCGWLASGAVGRFAGAVATAVARVMCPVALE
jgi:hypothetical protein